MNFCAHFIRIIAVAFLIASPIKADGRERGLIIVPAEDGGQTQIVPNALPLAGPEGTTFPKAEERPAPAPKLRVIDAVDAGSDPAFKKTALVFGNSRYSKLPSLRNTDNDAELIAATFQQMGFAVWLGVDLTYVEMLEITQDFVARSSDSTLIAFYYAGHGVQIAGHNLVFGIDADVTDKATLEADAIEIDHLINLVESNGANTVIFIDACRDNPFGEQFSSELNIAAGGLAKIEARTGTMVNYATAPGLVAYDGEGDNGPFALALSKHLGTRDLALELAMVRVRAAVYGATDGRQVPWSHSSLLEEIVLVPGASPGSSPTSVAKAEPAERNVDPDLMAFLQDAAELRVNGSDVALRGATPDERADGAWTQLREGLNYIEAGTRRMKVWVDGQSAHVFSRGYDQSHAILIAIDDYPRATGFRPLGFMESHARALAERLQTMGFPRDNIVEIYGENATRDRILAELDRFWGERNDEQRDRLLIYYGGHGSHLERETGSEAAPVVQDGFLVPYDFDPDRPLRSAILLEDLDSHNLKRSNAHHTLLLLDVCSSGLLLRQYQGEAPARSPEGLSVSQRWQRIRTNLENPHAAVIVAGTGDERALWENGGVFTKALLDGLGGQADMNTDGIISYDELSAFLSLEVRHRTSVQGIDQSPADFGSGRGRFFFEWDRF